MTLTVTLWLLVAAVAFGAFCAWRGAQPPNLLKGPRMAPWRFLMILMAALALLLAVHVANLLGVHTGPR